MSHIEPQAQAMAAFVTAVSNQAELQQQALAMLNLLRFRDVAAYAEGSEHAACSGREAYARYAQLALPRIQAVGGRVLYYATAWLTLIGAADESWDEAFIVEYPNAAAFLQMVQDPQYQAILPHRQAALADSRLIALKDGRAG